MKIGKSSEFYTSVNPAKVYAYLSLGSFQKIHFRWTLTIALDKDESDPIGGFTGKINKKGRKWDERMRERIHKLNQNRE